MEPIPTYMRERMVKAVHDGASVAEVARRFDVSETAVWNFVNRAEEGQSLEPKPRSGGPKPKLDEEDRQKLVDAVDQDPDATLEELIEQCDLDVSDSTVSRELKRLDRPRKRKVPRASEQDEETTQQQRQQWRTKTKDVDAERLIFVDETGISTKMTRRYGRAPANQRVYTDVPHRHYKNLTVLGGIRLGGSEQIPTLVYPGGTTTERMLEYIHGPLAEVLRPRDIVVADNLAAHKANKVTDALEEYEADIWLLPPYSPDLNPIERLWSKSKRRSVKPRRRPSRHSPRPPNVLWRQSPTPTFADGSATVTTSKPPDNHKLLCRAL